jgi:hypothetical protein
VALAPSSLIVMLSVPLPFSLCLHIRLHIHGTASQVSMKVKSVRKAKRKVDEDRRARIQEGMAKLREEANERARALHLKRGGDLGVKKVRFGFFNIFSCFLALLLRRKTCRRLWLVVI